MENHEAVTDILGMCDILQFYHSFKDSHVNVLQTYKMIVNINGIDRKGC